MKFKVRSEIRANAWLLTYDVLPSLDLELDDNNNNNNDLMKHLYIVALFLQ